MIAFLYVLGFATALAGQSSMGLSRSRMVIVAALWPVSAVLIIAVAAVSFVLKVI